MTKRVAVTALIVGILLTALVTPALAWERGGGPDLTSAAKGM